MGFSIYDIQTPGKLDIEMLNLHTEVFDDANFSTKKQKQHLFKIIQSIIVSGFGSGHLQIIAKKTL